MTTAPIDLHEAMALLAKSKRLLAPVYEAISNAIEAIAQRQKRFGLGDEGAIDVKLHFVGLFADSAKLDRIDIVDNGIGFDDENYNRFKLLLDRTKGYNNRGSGRIQYLHSAETISIVSLFQLGEKIIRRSFQCDAARYVSPPNDEEIAHGTPTGSTVTLSKLRFSKKELDGLNTIEASALKNDVKNHFLLRLYLDATKGEFPPPLIRITFVKAGDVQPPEIIKAADVPIPQSTGQFVVPYVRIQDPLAEKIEWVPVVDKPATLAWAHFKLPQTELAENEVVLCSKNVIVQELPFKEIKKSDSVAGNRFLTAIYGGILDDANNVSHAVDNFTFPRREEAEKQIREGDLFIDPAQPVMLFDSIKEGVDGVIPSIYSELFDLHKQQELKIEEIAKAHGIPLEVARAARIKLTDTEDQLTVKIYREQSDQLATENLKIKALYESLVALNPTDANYRDELERRCHELLEYIPQQNKRELARYVIRRDMVTRVLKLILANALADQIEPKSRKGKRKVRTDKEGLIHDLIFKRKSKTTSGPNDLWVLNEEFVHFEGCSELPINQIADSKGNKLLRPITDEEILARGVKPERRPDVFLYPEEGKCVLIEFKEPDADLSNHLNQIVKYCNLIANYSVQKITKFYCYLIGENISSNDLDGDYSTTVNGDWIRDPIRIRSYDAAREDVPIAMAQLEVIKLSSLYQRARRRNKSFADKLGLPDPEQV